MVTQDRTRRTRRSRDREEGVIIKDWGGRLPIALTYPNSYYLGMSNLGIHAIYSILNSEADIVCERVFWEEAVANTRHTVLSVESRRPPGHFAVLAFSLAYELDYLNIPRVLKASGIPLYASERDETHPLIIAGGACITANPLPVAPFFDCLCIGEAEAILPAFVGVFREQVGGNRDELLSALAEIPGVYVPRRPRPRVARQWARNLDDSPVHSVVLTRDTELGDLYLIEAERGCPWGCRFCLVSSIFNPMRAHSLESILEQARVGLQFRRRIGLVGPDVPSHPRFEELLARLKDMGAEIAISSLRTKPSFEFAFREVARGTGTVTLAPEAGSERLRRVIKKGVTEADIMQTVELVAGHGIKHLRLYFMIGLPTETEDDIEAIVALAMNCKAVIDRKHPTTRITLSIAPFVPKAGTPFQWLPMEQPSELKARMSIVRTRLRPRGIKVVGESVEWSQAQAILARGDEKLATVLATMEEVSLPAWRGALGKCGIDGDSYAHGRRERSQLLPWGMIDHGTRPGHLETELEQAIGDKADV